jgi:hypothetical protein
MSIVGISRAEKDETRTAEPKRGSSVGWGSVIAVKHNRPPTTASTNPSDGIPETAPNSNRGTLLGGVAMVWRRETLAVNRATRFSQGFGAPADPGAGAGLSRTAVGCAQASAVPSITVVEKMVDMAPTMEGVLRREVAG